MGVLHTPPHKLGGGGGAHLKSQHLEAGGRKFKVILGYPEGEREQAQTINEFPAGCLPMPTLQAQNSSETQDFELSFCRNQSQHVSEPSFMLTEPRSTATVLRAAGGRDGTRKLSTCHNDVLWGNGSIWMKRSPAENTKGLLATFLQSHRRLFHCTGQAELGSRSLKHDRFALKTE